MTLSTDEVTSYRNLSQYNILSSVGFNPKPKIQLLVRYVEKSTVGVLISMSAVKIILGQAINDRVIALSWTRTHDYKDEIQVSKCQMHQPLGLLKRQWFCTKKIKMFWLFFFYLGQYLKSLHYYSTILCSSVVHGLNKNNMLISIEIMRSVCERESTCSHHFILIFYCYH